MKRLLFLFFLFSVSTFAQGVRFGDGQPVQGANTPGGIVYSVPNATINFCNYPANGVPCTNKATTYTSITLGTPCPANQQVVLTGTTTCVGRTDGYGNWGVWVASGNYSFTVQLPTGGFAGPYNVTLANTGGGGSGFFPVGTNAQFVAANGNDNNDGLSPKTAKLTVYAALEALPGGSASPPTAGVGNINIMGTVSYGGPLSGGGFYLLGAQDPAYPTPPSGWLLYSGPVALNCIAPNNSLSNGHVTTCQQTTWGSNSSANLPSYWFSGTNNTIEMHGLQFQYLWTVGKLGISTTGNRTTSGAQGITFDGVGGNLNCTTQGGARLGPNVDIGSNVFWVWFKNGQSSGCQGQVYDISSISRSSNVVTVVTTQTNDFVTGDELTLTNVANNSFDSFIGGTYTITGCSGSPQKTCTFNQTGPNVSSSGGQAFGDRAAAVNIDPGGACGSGLIFFENYNTQIGSIRYTQGSCGGYGLGVKNLTLEGDFTNETTPAVLFTNINNFSANDISGVQMADAVNNTPAVENDSVAVNSSALNASGLATSMGAPNLGAMTFLGTYPANQSGVVQPSPLQQGQVGFSLGDIIGFSGNAQRQFSPNAVRWQNIAPLPAAWTVSGGDTLTQNITDPAGGTSAAQASTVMAGTRNLNFMQSNIAISVGDYFIVHGGLRSVNGGWLANPYTSGTNFLNTNTSGDVLSCRPGFGATGSLSDGEWDQFYSVCQVTVAGTSPAQINSGYIYDTGHPIQAYGVTIIHVPTGTISPNEAAEIANNLGSYSPTCAVGSDCLNNGQNLAVPLGTLAVNGGFNTYTDTGATNALTITTSPTFTSIPANWSVTIIPNHTNTGTTTLNPNGIGVQPVKKNGASANLAAGDITAGNPYTFQWDGTQFNLMSTSANAASGSGVTLETNGSNNASQATLNLLNSNPFQGMTLTVTNTSAGNVQLGATGNITLPFQINGLNFTNQTGVNFITSTTNSIGLTATPSNPGTNQEKSEITGTLGPAGGGCGVANPTAHSLFVAEGGSNCNLVTSPAVNGFYNCGFNVTASAAVDPTCTLPGIPVNPQSGNYSLLYSDRASEIRESGTTTSTITLCQITGNCASNYPLVTANFNSGTETLTANAADKIDGGSTGGSSTVPANFASLIYQDNTSAPGNWWTIKFPMLAAFPTTSANQALTFSGTAFAALSNIFIGPGSSTDNDLVCFNGSTGLLGKECATNIAAANVVTAASAASAAKQVCSASGASKTCTYIDFPQVLDIPAANCNNTTAGAGWSIGSGGTVTCRAGTNNLGGYIAITDTASTFATFQIAIPEDWDTGSNPYIRFQLASTDATNAHTIIPSIQVACYKGDGSTTDDVAANAAHSLSTTTLNGNANRFWSTSNVQMNSTDVTGCVAGALMQITVGRATDTATNAEFYSATVTFPRLITVQAN